MPAEPHGSKSAGPPDGADWHVPHGHVSAPTYWPMVLALGVAVLFWGFMTMPVVGLIGLGLMIIAIAGWIGAVRHEHERT